MERRTRPRRRGPWRALLVLSFGPVLAAVAVLVALGIVEVAVLRLTAWAALVTIAALVAGLDRPHHRERRRRRSAQLGSVER